MLDSGGILCLALKERPVIGSWYISTSEVGVNTMDFFVLHSFHQHFKLWISKPQYSIDYRTSRKPQSNSWSLLWDFHCSPGFRVVFCVAPHSNSSLTRDIALMALMIPTTLTPQTGGFTKYWSIEGCKSSSHPMKTLNNTITCSFTAQRGNFRPPPTPAPTQWLNLMAWSPSPPTFSLVWTSPSRQNFTSLCLAVVAGQRNALISKRKQRWILQLWSPRGIIVRGRRRNLLIG